MTIELDRSIRKVVPRFCKNPIEIVNYLTANKNTELEKFEAIFSWVLLEKSGRSSAEFTPTSLEDWHIKEILKQKDNSPENICRLMDTLCGIAGLSNYSIRGSVKDFLFDVNDSLFLANHIWSAVKLEGAWYLYDLNWCKGQYILVLKPFSAMVVKCHLDKRKTIKEIEVRSKIKKSFCDKIPPVTSFTIVTRTRLNRFLLKQLGKIKIKSSWEFDNKINTRFYLSSPDYFALSHYPVVNHWSLLGSTKNIHWFEADSSFYYSYWDSDAAPEREGRSCVTCDADLLTDAQKKYNSLLEENHNCNPRNTAINWYAKAKIGMDLFEQAEGIQDSLGKVTMLDSALKTYTSARDDVYKTYMDVFADWQEHLQKNAIKGALHYESNKWNSAAVGAIISENKNRTRDFWSFSQVFNRHTHKFRRQLEKNCKLYSDSIIPARRPVSQQVLDMYRSTADEANYKARVIDSTLSNSTGRYEEMLQRLSENIWSKHAVLSKISEALSDKAFYTKLTLLDHYKKDIRDLDRDIREHIKTDFEMLYKDIYWLSDSAVSLGTSILKLMDERNKNYLIASNCQRDLVKHGELQKDSLRLYLKVTGQKIQNDACALIEKSANQQSVLRGYERFYAEEKFLEGNIRFNRDAERYRNKEINRLINERRRQNRSVPKRNLVSTRMLELQVITYKRAYLKSLKKARKDALKKK